MKRIPTLKEICIEQLVNAEISAISFVGVPPHIVAQILVGVRSPKELQRIEDRPENRNTPGMKEALEEKWFRFVMDKYWTGRPTPPTLPKGWTWRKFFESLEAERHEANEIRLQQTEKSKEMEKKKKKDKHMDPSAARFTNSSSSGGSRYAATPRRDLGAPGSLMNNFMKKYKWGR